MRQCYFLSPKDPREFFWAILLIAQVDNDEELAAANTRLAIAGEGQMEFAEKKQKKTQNDRITWATFKDFITRRKNWIILLGCSGTMLLR